jgi:hypothetical protein
MLLSPVSTTLYGSTTSTVPLPKSVVCAFTGITGRDTDRVKQLHATEFRFWPKRFSLGISENPPTCGFGITRYPDEGGDGSERGAKLGATARRPWWKGSSGVLGRPKVAVVSTEPRSVHPRGSTLPVGVGVHAVATS